MKIPKYKPRNCYYCGVKITEKSDQAIEDVPVTKNDGVKMIPQYFHIKCVDTYFESIEKENLALKEDRESSETAEWEKVYNYMKKDILDLPDGINLSKHAVMRLRGLYVGKYYPNSENTLYRKSGYPYEVILMTMKLKKLEILHALKVTDFKDDSHRINYIMTILTNNINYIYQIYNKNLKAKRLAEKQTFDYEENISKHQGNKQLSEDELTVAEEKANEWVKDQKERRQENDFIL